MKRLSALDVLKSVRREMNPNANIGEYTLPVILKAMHVYAALQKHFLDSDEKENQLLNRSQKLREQDIVELWKYLGEYVYIPPLR